MAAPDLSLTVPLITLISCAAVIKGIRKKNARLANHASKRTLRAAPQRILCNIADLPPNQSKRFRNIAGTQTGGQAQNEEDPNPATGRAARYPRRSEKRNRL